MPPSVRTSWSTLLACMALGMTSAPCHAWELAGDKAVILHAKDGSSTRIGSVNFRDEGAQIAFTLGLDHAQLKDYFLSMREFKCREGDGELLCHVPYPYRSPARITTADFAWLEHALLFFYKAPRDFGAKLWNGIYFRLERTAQGLVGTPQAIDLNQIGAPPATPDVPPYGAAERTDIPAGARWFHKLTIE